MNFTKSTLSVTTFGVCLSLLFSFSAVAELLDPARDSDVIPHIQRGYYELKDGDKPLSNITLQQTEKIRDDFLKVFEARSWMIGHDLDVTIPWDNPYFSANASWKGVTSSANLWGGFLRAPGMSPVIIVTTLCHEMGHLVGGPPYMSNQKERNFSSEGQSDFFAAFTCLPEFSRHFPSYFEKPSPGVTDFCRGNSDCIASLEGGLQTVRFLQKWSFKIYKPVSFSTGEKPTSELFNNSYPSDQCRFDTFVRAATCHRDQVENCQPPPCWWPWSLMYPPSEKDSK